MSLFRSTLYSKTGNWLARNLLRPFSAILPDNLQFPVVGRVRVRLPNAKGVTLLSNPTSYCSKQVFWNGYRGFEPDLFPLFVRLVQEASVFFDVGANIGYYSLIAPRYNSDIEVHSFEPLPSAFRHLRQNCVNNGIVNVTAIRAALSDTDGESAFYAARNPKFDSVAMQLTSTGSLDRVQAHRTPLVDEIMVKTMKLDTYVNSARVPRLDLLKLDTEATEHLVLAGGQEVIGRFKPVILCEVLPGRVEVEIGHLLEEFGYEAFSVTASGLRHVTDLRHNVSSTNDHVFFHKSQQDRINSYVDRGHSGASA